MENIQTKLGTSKNLSSSSTLSHALLNGLITNSNIYNNFDRTERDKYDNRYSLEPTNVAENYFAVKLNPARNPNGEYAFDTSTFENLLWALGTKKLNPSYKSNIQIKDYLGPNSEILITPGYFITPLYLFKEYSEDLMRLYNTIVNYGINTFECNLMDALFMQNFYKISVNLEKLTNDMKWYYLMFIAKEDYPVNVGVLQLPRLREISSSFARSEQNIISNGVFTFNKLDGVRVEKMSAKTFGISSPQQKISMKNIFSEKTKIDSDKITLTFKQKIPFAKTALLHIIEIPGKTYLIERDVPANLFKTITLTINSRFKWTKTYSQLSL